MHNIKSIAVIPCQNYFLADGILRYEKVEIAFVRTICRIDTVTAGVHEFLAGRDALPEIPFPVIFRIHCLLIFMVFAESALEKTETGLEGKGSPFGYTVQGFLGRKILYRIIYILYHLLHHEFPAVPRFVEVRVSGTELMVIPRHIPETFDLLEIEISPEEPCQSIIFRPHGCILAVDGILEQGIEVPEGRPVPSSS